MFWYENDVAAVERKKQQFDLGQEYYVFYGSSSFNYWVGDLEEDLGLSPVFNAAFGGSTLAACCWYFPRIMRDLKAKALVLYAGDNDVGDKRHSEELYISFTQLVQQWKDLHPGKPIVFVSIKPSPSRADLKTTIYFANQHIKNFCENDEICHYIDIYSDMLNEVGEPNSCYFTEDGLHMNRSGYELWISKMKPVLEELIKN